MTYTPDKYEKLALELYELSMNTAHCSTAIKFKTGAINILHRVVLEAKIEVLEEMVRDERDVVALEAAKRLNMMRAELAALDADKCAK